jgi:aerobic carbon-monoxide dehydrogenase large subunit
VVDKETGEARMPLGRARPHRLFPRRHAAQGPAARTGADAALHHQEYPFAFTNGVQASYVEVDTETGFVKLLKHWCVEDCGRIINPQLVDEQIRGGIVQGSAARSTRNASMTRTASS